MKKFLLVLILPLLLFSGEGYVKSWKTGYKPYLKRELYSSASQQDIALSYLNSLRQKAGLTAFIKNSYLKTASQNHVNYMVANNTAGHQEYSGNSNFTGEWPADRAVYAGYKSRMVSENLSWGQDDIYESIDGLFSAIYHRFGFLDTTKNDIGIGLNESQKFYNYDMGNSYLNELCNGTSFDGTGQYTYDVCADENFKISLDDFNSAENNISKNNPKIVLWPYKNATDIPPVFFEESPDPLPNYSVSGYPISVSFNQYYYQNPPTFISFKLFDKDDNEITNTFLLDSQSDPNNEITSYQFALFPLKRLGWGKVYKAIFEYDDGNGTKEIVWSFKAKTLPYPYYELGASNNQTLELISGKTYAIYFIPRDGNDNLGGYHFSYENGMSIDSDYIDADTIKVKLTGSLNQQATLNFDNGRSVTLKIANSDNAITSEENLTESNSSTISDIGLKKEKIDSLQSGWTLLGSSFDIGDLSIFSSAKIVWIYNSTNSTWMAYSPNESTKQEIEDAGYTIFTNIPKDSGIWVLK